MEASETLPPYSLLRPCPLSSLHPRYPIRPATSSFFQTCSSHVCYVLHTPALQLRIALDRSQTGPIQPVLIHGRLIHGQPGDASMIDCPSVANSNGLGRRQTLHLWHSAVCDSYDQGASMTLATRILYHEKHVVSVTWHLPSALT